MSSSYSSFMLRASQNVSWYYEYTVIDNVVSMWSPVCAALHLEVPRQVAFLSHFGVRHDTDCQVAMAAVPFVPSLHGKALYSFVFCHISGLSVPCCRHDCHCMRSNGLYACITCPYHALHGVTCDISKLPSYCTTAALPEWSEANSALSSD